jgi:hypothetical protein
MKSTYCEYILEKILSTSEVGPILALIAPSPLSDYRTVRLSDYQTVGLSNCRTIELSDYRTVGPWNRRTIDIQI